MAETKNIEKIFTIPLRKAYETSRNRRGKAAAMLVRKFLKRHMKVEEVRIGSSINDAIWKRGIQKPPRRLRVHAAIAGDVVRAELVGVEIKVALKKESETKTAKVPKTPKAAKTELPKTEETAAKQSQAAAAAAPATPT